MRLINIIISYRHYLTLQPQFALAPVRLRWRR